MTWSAPDLLARHAEDAAGEPALRDGDTVWTWQELSRRADAAARSMLDRGVQPGDRVALVVSTTSAAVAGLFGILRAGAVAAPVPAGLTARETDAAIEAIEPVPRPA